MRTMNNIKVGLLLFIVTIFISCDCIQHVQGTVIDYETQLPIEDVAVIKFIDGIIYTDSLGNFDVTAMTGGLFGCPKLSLSFEKEGYNTATKKYKSCCTDNTVVTLKRRE
ncbi:hypothetical protein LJC06_04330 [Bacteroidales bacterium OttesenSCG-928-I14]|nr:hypothetical protein [Bacteroidales bacterium OttesenSCG-928-I14]